MTVTATKFTPEVLLSAPRRSSGVPNSTGTHALYTVSQYSFESHAKSYAIKVLDLKTGSSTVLYENPAYTEPTWISEKSFVFVHNRDNNAGTRLMLADVTRPGAEYRAAWSKDTGEADHWRVPVCSHSPQEISSFKGLIANIKVKDIGGGTIAFACTAPTTPSGELYDPVADGEEKKKTSFSSAKVYSSLFVRHWDSYVGENKNAVWYGALKKTKKGSEGKTEGEGASEGESKGENESYELQKPGLVNALAGTRLECPVPNFGGAGDYDIGPAGLVFVSKDPDLNPALWTKTDLYYVPLRTFTEAAPPRPPQLVPTGALQGYTGSPVFSHGGSAVAFKRMRHRQYESDKWRLLLLPDVAGNDLANVQEFYATDDGEGGWDLRPETIVWSNDDSELYVTAEKEGRSALFKLPSRPLEAAKALPRQLTRDGTVGDFFNLTTAPKTDGSNSNGSSKGDERLFLNASSLVESSAYAILDPRSSESESGGKDAFPEMQVVSSSSKGGRSFGLSQSQFDEFWFDGAGGEYRCHALVMKPSSFDPEKKYPLAFLIHGGPQGAWGESWSTRWNPAIFAEQGYVVVMPNPTGSTGYGQALTDGIATEWGGRPYNDLVNCFEHIEGHLPYVDTHNAVALGASYGGYMINWIQGQPLGRRFKALVCHDGIFSTMSDWATEELFFVVHDMGGTLWEARDRYERWDPAAHTGNWQTPQLVVHSELDYRLPISEGLAAFNVLQARGVPSRLVVFPDENHWVLKPENSLVWHKEVLGWINKYTGLDTSGLAEDAKRLAL
ncbi:hypothetical protein SLS62_008519 [Diatrype stigma]|uniref:Dipeptidyl-peptidase V n=1 Tax=Diatrype stigma TaxID=117547 RepID=A0AAN9UHJ0_9PEZI